MQKYEHIYRSGVIWCLKCYSQMRGYQEENKMRMQ
jgi:hypothetical protein